MINPAHGRVVGICAEAGNDIVQQAVDTASECFNSGVWSGQRPAHRAQILRKIASMIKGSSEDLARAETIGCGKLLSDSRMDVDEAAGEFLQTLETLAK
jgi:acyl-CoA reductase-like NAD-dependent aldehyde dehydrogenase